MPEHGVGQRVAELRAHAVEAGDLRAGVVVLLGHVRAVEVREERGDLHFGRRVEGAAEGVELLLHEAQAVHPRIELDVDRIAAFARMGGRRGEGLQRVEAVYFGFETVGDHRAEAVGVGVEHHDRHRDAPFAQQHPFVGEGDGEVVDPLVLEQLRHLEIARAVRSRLDHRHEAGPEGEFRAEAVQVVGHGVEVDLEDRRVALPRQGVGDAFEAVVARPLQQDGASRHSVAADAGDALARRGVELLLAVEQGGVAAELRADADQIVDARAADHRRHAAVELLVRQTALGDLREDEGAGASEGDVVEVVERQRQRVEVEVVGVVDEDRIVDPLLHLQPHRHVGHGREGGGGVAHRREEGFD